MFYGINFSQCILHDSAVFFSHFQSFFKLWMWQLVSFGQPIPQNEWIIRNHFYISALQIWRDKILRHWSNFNVFYMFEQCLSQNGRVIYSSLLYFNFENLKSSNSTSSTNIHFAWFSSFLVSVFDIFSNYGGGNWYDSGN